MASKWMIGSSMLPEVYQSRTDIVAMQIEKGKRKRNSKRETAEENVAPEAGKWSGVHLNKWSGVH